MRPLELHTFIDCQKDDIFNVAAKTQGALLTNLKARLEKQKPLAPPL